jgi:predicted  nucleic acid-binding Zn-ribbon protein
MSEFERTPESMHAELKELENRLTFIQDKFTQIEDGKYEEMGTKEEAEELFFQANKVKRNIYDLLVELQNYDEIRSKLEDSITTTVELYKDEEIPVYVEPALEDTFAISADEQLDANVQIIISELVDEYGLLKFETGEDTEE